MSDEGNPLPETSLTLGQEAQGPRPPGSGENQEETTLRDFQDWFLLRALADAKGQRLARGELNRKVAPERVKEQLHLNKDKAASRLEELHQEQLVQIDKAGRSVHYRITEQGQERLARLPPHPAFIPKPPPELSGISEEQRKYQEAYLLLQLLEGEEQTLTKGEANKKITKDMCRDLEMPTAVANYRRQQLAERGLIQIGKQGRTETFRLTPEGREELGGRNHHPGVLFRIKGSALNELMAIIKEDQRDLEPQAVLSLPLPADLQQAFYEEFQELVREKHGFTGLVPIHEIREKIQAKYGEVAARHDVLDEGIRQLRREGQIRLIAIDDFSKATTEQLNASIPGIDETLFYVEDAHAQPISR